MKKVEEIEATIEQSIELDPTCSQFSWAKRYGAAIAHLRDAERELAQFKAPAPSLGELETTWHGVFASYVVHFDYFEADNEAGQHESVIMNSIFVNGDDVLEELSSKVLEQIEAQCFEVVAHNRRESEFQASEDRGAALHEEKWAA